MTDSTPPMGQFIGGSALQTDAAPLAPPPGEEYMYWPTPVQPVTIQGTGGWVSPGAQLVSGLQAGMAVANSYAAARARGAQYRAQQQARKAGAENAYLGGGGTPGGVGDPGNPQPSLLDLAIARARGVMPSQVSQPLATSINAETNQALATMPQGVASIPGVTGYADGGPVASPAPLPAPTLQAIPAPAAGPMPMVPGSAAGAPPAQALSPAEAIDDHGALLQLAALNDDGIPHHLASPAGIASPVQSANYPAPGQTHSLTPDFWDATDASARRFAQAAAMAGQDPTQAYHSAIALRNSFFQGHVLKNLSAAYAASQAGDQDAVEHSLRNLYYYMPDGQDLQLHRGSDGTVQYQDPFNPMTAEGKPNFVDVTPEHLQILGQAALDPQNVANSLLRFRMIPFQMGLAQEGMKAKLLTAQGMAARGAGINSAGQADLQKAQAAMERVASQNYLDLSLGDRARMQTASQRLISTMLTGARINPQVQANVSSTLKLLDGAVTGTPMGSDPNSVAGGRVVPNPKSVPKYLQGISSTDFAGVQSVASGFAATGMAPGQASQLALQWYQLKGQTHSATNDKSGFAKANSKGGQIPNVIADPRGGRVWFWYGSRWQQYPMLPQGASMLAGGSTGMQQMLLRALIAGQGADGLTPSQVGAGAPAPSPISAEMDPYSSDQ